MSGPEPDHPPGGGETMSDQVERKAARKLKARRTRQRGVWFGLGMFGLVGWAVAVPTLLGVLLGAWLDGRFPGRASWTLTFLIIGIGLGCLNAWFWVSKESRHDD